MDALHEEAVARHLDAVAADAGRVDVSFNAVGFDNGEQGVLLVETSADDDVRAVSEYARTHFITATAAGRRMSTQGGGAIVTLSNPTAEAPAVPSGCFGRYAAVVENLIIQLAGELGPAGVRVVCVRPTGMPASATEHDNLTGRVWRRASERLGITFDVLLEHIGGGTMRGKHITTQDVAETAGFVASDRASGMTGTVANVTGGAIPDDQRRQSRSPHGSRR